MINSFPYITKFIKIWQRLKFFFIDVNDVLRPIFENKVMGNYNLKPVKIY